MSVELDYAFLAKWARVNDDSTLTAIDASFTQIGVRVGEPLSLSVAGRVRFLAEPYAAVLAVVFEVPGGKLTFTTSIGAEQSVDYSPGRRHILFALNAQVPVNELGLCRVIVSIDGENVRELVCELKDN